MEKALSLSPRLCHGFDAVVILDTETTGLSFRQDHILELAALRLEGQNGQLHCTGEMDDLIRLPPGQQVPPFIAGLTGITDEQLAREGVDAGESCRRFASLLEGEKLLI